MEFPHAALLILVSFGASWLTFFSGFGLGTLLTPVFYFLLGDLTLAITATAIVHLTNNLFKFGLMQRNVNWKVVVPFGIAAIPAANARCLFNKPFYRHRINLIIQFLAVLKALN